MTAKIFYPESITHHIKKRLAENVSEYVAFASPHANLVRDCIAQVATDEKVSFSFVQEAVNLFGIDTSRWDDEL